MPDPMKVAVCYPAQEKLHDSQAGREGDPLPGAIFCSTECPMGGCQGRGETEGPWPFLRWRQGEGQSPPCCVLRRARLCATTQTVARQAPLSMGSSRHEDWSWLPFPSPGDLPNQGSNLVSPAPAGGSSLPAEPPVKPPYDVWS